MGNINSVSMNRVESMILGGRVGRRSEWAECDPKHEHVVDVVHRQLADENSGGLILQGHLGSGKREIVHEVTTAETYLGRDMHLCGTRYAQFIPYGVLHFLLSDMEGEGMTSPLFAYEHLRSKLKELDVVPVFVIERVDLIDSWTVIALVQLTYAKEIKLLIIDDLGAPMPTEVMNLVHSGFIAVHRIEPLTVQETNAMVEAIAGLRPTDFVATLLWDYSEGNPQWLYSLVREGLSQGILERCDGWIVSSRRRMPTGGAVGEVARFHVAGLSVEQRQVLNMIVEDDYSGTQEVLRSRADVVDSLVETRFLSTAPDSSGHVRLRSQILRDCLHTMNRLERATDSGASVDNDQLGAFEVELSLADACAFLEGASTDMPSIGTVRYVANRLINAGKSKDALLVVSKYRDILSRGIDHQSRVHELVSSHSTTQYDLMLLELQISIRIGDSESMSVLLGALEPGQGSRHRMFLDRNRQLEATAYMAEAFLRLHRWNEALPKVQGLGRVILASEGFLRPGENSAANARIVRSLLSSSLAIGEWTLCNELCGLVRTEPVHDPDLVEFAEVIRAILLVAKGDMKTGESILNPMERQLLAGGPPEEHEAVASVLAYCHAASGSLDAAAQYLYTRPFQGVNDTPYGWLIEFFRAMSIAKVHSPDASNLRLLALSQSPGTVKNPLLRMYTLAVSVRQGNFSAARDLEEATLCLEGGFAEAFRRFARGVEDRESQQITSAFISLIELGLAAFAGETGNVPFTLLPAADQRNIQRKIKGTIRTNKELQRWNGKSFDIFPDYGSLTRREQFIAAAAADGLSNAEIAEAASVSVRTVEGHLYQIYSKLGLRGRAGLTDLLSNSTPYQEASNAGK